MPEWLIILIVFFVVSRVVRARGHDARCMSGRSHRLRERERARALQRERHRSVPAPKVESPMEALQRKYVDGSITVEEYEAELDRLYRPG
jgi:uncharacterized membrane protein